MGRSVYFIDIDTSVKPASNILIRSPQCRCVMYSFSKYICALRQNEKLLVKESVSLITSRQNISNACLDSH